eukprot:6360108-Karenia_brevis.AAC.1
MSIFPGHKSPLSILAILVGYPQTRKSQMTRLAQEIGSYLDQHLRDLAIVQLQALNVERPEKVELHSAVISSFTAAAMFERCSGDFMHIKSAEDWGVAEPIYFGRMANSDEIYAAFQEFGLVQDERKRSGQSGSGAVNPHAGALNRYLQFGECGRATKGSGTFGGGQIRPTSFGGLGNIHPEVAIPVLQGQLGNHT